MKFFSLIKFSVTGTIIVKVYLIILDINECYVDEDLCSPEAECLNTDGGYQCRCFEGYKGDGFTCQSELSEQPSGLHLSSRSCCSAKNHN